MISNGLSKIFVQIFVGFVKFINELYIKISIVFFFFIIFIPSETDAIAWIKLVILFNCICSVIIHTVRIKIIFLNETRVMIKIIMWNGKYYL